ncbi:MAG: ribosome maturation factor RimM [Clostridia bacterium]|nr:ribosome maturation factor RimM [Clostridia bacterium]
MKEYFEVGQVVNTFGIKGEVKVKPFTDEPTRFDEFRKVFVEQGANLNEFEIENVKYHKNVVLVKFKGIEDINKAETLRGAFIKIHRKDAKKLDKDTYFIADLLGLEVYTDENLLLGRVDDIYETRSNDVYVIKDKLGKQVLLPGTKEVIKQVDFKNEKIIVHIIKGLID